MHISLLLVAPLSPSLFIADSCLADRYYGTYGSRASAVFLTDASCVTSLQSEILSDASVVPFPSQHDKLVWVEEVQVEPALRQDGQSFTVELGGLIDRISKAESRSLDVYQNAQAAISYDTHARRRVVWRSTSSAIVSSSSEAVMVLDTMLPRFWRAFPLPLLPIPPRSTPPEALDTIKRVLSGLTFNPDVAAIVNNISIPQMRNDVRFLTGEDGKSGIVSRHSFAEGSRISAAWLKERFEETGALCAHHEFAIGFAPNVVCRYPAAVNTTATVVLGAHFDSRGSFGSIRAPGANDDGSGTVALLAIARVLSRRAKLKFRSNVEIVAFSGEEQGLLGSAEYARILRKTEANVTLMVQADMLGYRVPGEPPQLGLPHLRNEAPEVNYLVGNISAIYSPELTVGSTLTCCSDHQSFAEQGYLATHLFERAGPIADPLYHNSDDISEREGYDFEQIKSIAKVQFATLLHVAGFDVV